MTKTILLILVALSLVACGGPAFWGADEPLAGAGGDAAEAGAPGLAAGGSEVHVGGGMSSAGKATGGSVGTGGAMAGSAGVDTGGSVTGGTAGEGGTPATGGTQACVLDRAKLEQDLPPEVTWGGFDYTSGTTCVVCADPHCLSMSVPSWGVAVVPAPDVLQYGFNGGLARVAIGKVNGSTCNRQTECTAELASITWTLQVALETDHWVVTGSSARIFFQDNMCLETAAGGVSYDMGVAFEKDFGAPLLGLKIPCK